MKLVNSKMFLVTVFVMMNLKCVNSESETTLPQEIHQNKEENYGGLRQGPPTLGVGGKVGGVQQVGQQVGQVQQQGKVGGNGQLGGLEVQGKVGGGEQLGVKVGKKVGGVQGGLEQKQMLTTLTETEQLGGGEQLGVKVGKVNANPNGGAARMSRSLLENESESKLEDINDGKTTREASNSDI